MRNNDIQHAKRAEDPRIDTRAGRRAEPHSEPGRAGPAPRLRMRHLAYAAAMLAAVALVNPLAAQPAAPAGGSGPAAVPAHGAAPAAVMITPDRAETIARGDRYMDYPVFAKLATWNGRKVYRVDMTVDERLIVRHVYVDAYTGKVLQRFTTRGIDDPVWVGGGGGL